MPVLQIALDDEDTRRLAERAAQSGKPVDAFVRELIRDVVRPGTWAEIMAPMQAAMAGHGMSEDEVTDFLEEQLAAARRERREKEAR